MSTLFSFHFWLYFFYFFVSIFFACYIPGNVFLSKKGLSSFQQITLSLSIGLVLWIWQGYILGYLNLRWGTFLYLLFTTAFWIKSNSQIFLKKRTIPFDVKTHFPIILIVCIGVILQQIPVWYIVVPTKEAVSFCCNFLPIDQIWYLALTNQLIHRIPPFEPGLYGIVLHNYHYFGFIAPAELIRVFRLPLLYTQDQYFPFLVSLLYGLLAIVIAQLLNMRKAFMYWLLFFLYFSSDLFFAILYVFGKGLNMGLDPIADGLKFLINYPLAISIVVLFTGISLLLLWNKKQEFCTGLLMICVFGMLVGLKVYTGIFALLGLLSLSLYGLAKKNFRILVITIMVFIISLAIYLPVNENAGGVYFSGFWRIETELVNTLSIKNPAIHEMMFLTKKRRLLSQPITKQMSVLSLETAFLILYIVAVFGTKLLALWQTKKSFRNFPFAFHVFLIPACFVSLLLGLFFMQQSGGGNTYNFIVLVYIMLSFYTALSLSNVITKLPHKLEMSIVFIVILLNGARIFTRGIILIENNFTQPLTIHTSELAALNYLKEKTLKNSLVLVDPNNNNDYLSPYVSVFSDRPMFYSGANLQFNHVIDDHNRGSSVKTIFSRSNYNVIKASLASNKIDYLYLDTQTAPFFETKQLPLKTVFANESKVILQITH